MFKFISNNGLMSGYGETSYEAMVNAMGKQKADIALDFTKDTRWTQSMGIVYAKNDNVIGYLYKI